MWKNVCFIKDLCHFKGSTCLLSRIQYNQGRRFMLSEAYKCQETWDRRLQAPILQNIKLDELYYELDQKFQQNGQASVIDIDLFANAVTEEVHIEELEDVMHKLRFSSSTVNMRQSTSHAFIRIFLALGKHQELLKILNDSLNYGIFPDDYCLSFLMDTFIKNQNYIGAAKVSVLQMLQEDWSNPLVSHLALYSCHMYLREPGEWAVTDSKKHQNPEENEEVKVRVKFLRNPFFDDHFDLCDPYLLVGKTLAALAATIPDNVGRTYHVIGLSLYQKWDECKSLLSRFLANKQDIFKEGVTLVEEMLEKRCSEDSFQETKKDILTLLQKLVARGLATEGDIHKAVLKKVQLVVKKQEVESIRVQQEVYQSWENSRMEELQRQIETLRVQQRLSKVQVERQQLVQKEQELFFFDNEDKWDLVIESKQIFYPKRYFGKKKKKKVEDETYVPPEL